MMMSRLTEQEAGNRKSSHGVETAQPRYAHLGSKQPMASLNIVTHPLDEGRPRNNDSIQGVDTADGESTAARIPERFALVIRNKTGRAAMVRPSKQNRPSDQGQVRGRDGLWSFANNHRLTHHCK